MFGVQQDYDCKCSALADQIGRLDTRMGMVGSLSFSFMTRNLDHVDLRPLKQAVGTYEFHNGTHHVGDKFLGRGMSVHFRSAGKSIGKSRLKIKESGRFARDNVAGLPSCFPAAGLFNGTARLESEMRTRPGDALQVALVFEFDLGLGA